MLTEKIARETPPPALGVAEILDDGPGGQRGLMLRITAGGVRSWCVRWSLNGRRKRKAIGRVGEMPLRLARSKAAKMRGAVDQGVSPEAAEGRNLTDLWEDYSIERARVLRRPELDRAIFDRYLRGAVKYKRPEDFRRPDWFHLDAALIAHGLAPNTRRSAHRVALGFFAWLVERGYLEVSPIPSRPAARRETRDRVPSLEEMRHLYRVAGEVGIAGQMVRLLQLTGLRREEARALRWSEVLDGELLISADRMKGGRPHRVPISCCAASLIEDRRAVCGKWSAFVFPALRDRKGDRPTGIKPDKALAAAGIPDCTIHDLRRGVASGLADLGTPPHVIGLTLSHAPSSTFGGVTSVYLKSDFMPERRAALEAWAEALAG